MRKIVYISHPVGGDESGNLEKVMDIGRRINLSGADVVPFCPWIFDVMCLDGSVEGERALGIRNRLLVLRSGIVDELWLYGDYISSGMFLEIEVAREMGLGVLAMSSSIQEIFKTKNEK